jgi:23S rRNA (pseudouridine1915-N3)-methyltransferase
MYKIIITWDSFKHFESPIKEYIKRLWKTCEIVKLKPVKNWSDSQIIEKETNNLIKFLEKQSWFKIVLNPLWKSFDTSSLYNFIEWKKQNFWNIVFIIWWALGLDYKNLKNHIDFEINLWELTMPHSLALLVLLEQIYRLEMIKKGTSYDK